MHIVFATQFILSFKALQKLRKKEAESELKGINAWRKAKAWLTWKTLVPANVSGLV